MKTDESIVEQQRLFLPLLTKQREAGLISFVYYSKHFIRFPLQLQKLLGMAVGTRVKLFTPRLLSGYPGEDSDFDSANKFLRHGNDMSMPCLKK